MPAQEVALRKRQQIANANRMMFIWVAAVSIVVGFSFVTGYFLWQKAQFNERVLAKMSTTVRTLDGNIEAVDELKNQVRVLNSNQALKDSMAPGQDQAIRVVLDALPSDANSAALASSLQERFLNGDGIRIESLNAEPVAGEELQLAEGVQDAALESTGENEILFQFTVSVAGGDANTLKSLLQRLERSIRAIDLTSVVVETQGERLILSATGRAYYEPAKTAGLKEETVK